MFGIVDVLQAVQEKVIHRLDVLRKDSHCDPPVERCASNVSKTQTLPKRNRSLLLSCSAKPQAAFDLPAVPPRLNVKTDGRRGFEIIGPSLISACAFKMRIVRRASLVARSGDRPVKQELTPAKVVFY
jgi:hypothetical protein